MLDTPFIRLLETYGINALNVPQETRIGHSADGITIDEFATDSDGYPIYHHDTQGRIRDHVIVTTFYPHPDTAVTD